MTVIKFTAPFADLADPQGVGDNEDIVSTPTRITAPLEDGLFISLFGRIVPSETFAGSVVDRVLVSGGADGADPIVRITGFRTELAEEAFADFLARITDGADKVLGSPLADVLVGLAGAGNDLVKGGGGDDVLNGGEGRDKLQGGDGDDLLVSANGGDVLTGGKGADEFALDNDSAGTLVTDFRKGEDDRLVLGVSALFDGRDPREGEPSDFILLRANGQTVTLLIDADGGGEVFDAVATIKGDLGTNLDQLITDGTIGFGFG